MDGTGYKILWLGRPKVTFQFFLVSAGVKIQAIGVGFTDGTEIGI